MFSAGEIERSCVEFFPLGRHVSLQTTEETQSEEHVQINKHKRVGGVSRSGMPLWFRAEFFLGAGAAVRNPIFF